MASICGTPRSLRCMSTSYLSEALGESSALHEAGAAGYRSRGAAPRVDLGAAPFAGKVLPPRLSTAPPPAGAWPSCTMRWRDVLSADDSGWTSNPFSLRARLLQCVWVDNIAMDRQRWVTLSLDSLCQKALSVEEKAPPTERVETRTKRTCDPCHSCHRSNYGC